MNDGSTINCKRMGATGNSKRAASRLASRTANDSPPMKRASGRFVGVSLDGQDWQARQVYARRDVRAEDLL
ncbi:hypothetical protein [Paraburkholderia sabiae]|jgi:hypothetical protein|uniref:hypothetical protein n=1 Tax=Paraburkholderia sabiae TaxID=273251 RepID=UPI001CC557DE|nr:hypothetical protein [Paraburkholderia sabiae]